MRTIFFGKGRFWLWGAGFLCLLIGLGLWFLPQIGSSLARWQLGEAGFTGAGLTIAEVGLRSARVEGFDLESEGWRATVEEGRVSYSLGRLWREGKMDTLVLEGARVELDESWLAGLASASSEVAGDSEGTLDVAAWLEQAPVESVKVMRGQVALRSEGGLKEVTLEGRVKVEKREGAELTLEARDGETALEVAGRLGADGAVSGKVEGAFPDLLATLAVWYPDWKDVVALEERWSVATGPVSVKADFGGNVEGVELGFVTLAMADWRATYGEGGMVWEKAEARVERAGEAWTIALSGKLEEGFYNAAQLGEQALRLRFETESGERWKVSSEEGLEWSYDENWVRGRAERFSVEAWLEESGELSGFEGEADLADCWIDRYAVEMATVTFSGESDRVVVGTQRLGSEAAAGLEILDFEAEVRLLEGNATRTVFTGQAGENGLRFAIPEMELSGFGLEGAVESDEAGLRGRVGLTSLSGERLSQWESVFSAVGSLGLEISGAREGDEGPWKLEMEAKTEGDFAGSDWSAGGVSGKAQLAIAALDVERVFAEDRSSRAILEELLSMGRGAVEFSANEVKGGFGKAQWVGGELAVNEEGVAGSAGNSVRAWVSAGALETEAERLQQLGIEVTGKGDLSELSAAGTARFLYEGMEGNLAFEQELALDENFEATVEGSYELAPLVFDYSDLLSRRFEALRGLSVSGELGASGEFWLRDGLADARVAARLEKGAVAWPGSQLSVEGFEGKVELESAVEVRTAPDRSELTIETIRLGDIEARDMVLRFDLPSVSALELRAAEAKLWDGRIYLRPGRVNLETMNYAGRLNFESISLAELTRMMSFFDGKMEGAASGFLPLDWEAGVFRLGEGRLELASGETARLAYNAKGLLETETAGSKLTMGDRILKRLDLDPDRLVEEALGNFEIKNMTILLFPEDMPGTPMRINLEGVGRTGKAALPLNFQINVNGGLDELYTFLIRLNSLGSASF